MIHDAHGHALKLGKSVEKVQNSISKFNIAAEKVSPDSTWTAIEKLYASLHTSVNEYGTTVIIQLIIWKRKPKLFTHIFTDLSSIPRRKSSASKK